MLSFNEVTEVINKKASVQKSWTSKSLSSQAGWVQKTWWANANINMRDSLSAPLRTSVQNYCLSNIVRTQAERKFARLT